MNGKNKTTEAVAIYSDLTKIKQLEIERKKMEEAMGRQRRELQTIFDSVRAWIFYKDKENRFIRVNKSFAEVMKMPKKELEGKSLFDIYSKEQAEAYWRDDKEVMSSGKPKVNIIEPVQTKKGTLWVRTDKIPYRDERGNIIGVIGFTVDITEHFKMENEIKESEEKYRTLVESAQDAIFIADIETGIIIDANKKAEKLLGMPRKDIIGIHQTDLHPKEDDEIYKRIFNRDARGEKGSVTVAYVHNRNGYNIPVQINANIIEIKGKKYLMGIFRDVTDFIKTEEVLKGEKNNLEKVVSEKSVELRRALKELEDSKRLSDIGTLAATIAHELRNPLGVIKTAVYNIKNKTKDPSLKSHLVSIDKKILESDQIIKNLLTYSQVKMPRYETIIIENILDECVNHLNEKYANAKWDVEIAKKCKCEGCDAVEADPLQISELFSNLLDNAFQSFPDKKGRIIITGDCDKKENRFNISFSDNGVGIDKKDLPNIFDQFFTTRARGIGLGLSVCRQVVKLHGGEIKIESEKDKGTTVYVSLPIKRA